MDDSLALIHTKLDQLNDQIQVQQERLNSNSPVLVSSDFDLINQKLDFLLEQHEIQRKKQEEFDELKTDLMLIVNHLIKLTIDELAEIGTEFQMEDLLYIGKRVLRDTHILVDLLDRVESMAELFDETQILGKQVFNQAVVKLDEYERKGFFTFAIEGMKIMENIVQEFSEEDVQALGENIVMILRTIRNLTQPEIMSLANQSLDAIRTEPQDEKQSLFSLLRNLGDPKVRKGLSRLMNLLRVLADQPIEKSQ